jgi:phosphoglycolate phosphatase
MICIEGFYTPNMIPYENQPRPLAAGLIISAVFFDLDGVIINSLPDITTAVNAALCEHDFTALEESVVRAFIGKGARRLILKALEASARRCGKDAPQEQSAAFDDVYHGYVGYYKAHSVEKTVLYPGAKIMLDAYTARGIPLAIVSNKPLPVTEAALEKLGIAQYFLGIAGPEVVSKLKPDPESLEYALTKMNAARIQAGEAALTAHDTMLMLGDSNTDIQAGRAFGAKTCAVTGGYGNREELLAERADYVVEYAGEILSLLEAPD